MVKRRIFDEEGCAHFLTFSCFKRRRFLHPDAVKRIVLGTFYMYLSRENGRCVGFVLMPNHVHALVWFLQPNRLSPFMDKWKETSSKEIKRFFQKSFPAYWSKISATDPVWQPRYYDFNIYSEDKLREKLEYMHNNPVRAGLAAEPCAWPWSSALWYAQGKSVGLPIAWPA